MTNIALHRIFAYIFAYSYATAISDAVDLSTLRYFAITKSLCRIFVDILLSVGRCSPFPIPLRVCLDLPGGSAAVYNVDRGV